MWFGRKWCAQSQDFSHSTRRGQRSPALFRDNQSQEGPQTPRTSLTEMKHFPFKSKTSVRTEKRHLEGVLGLSGQKFFLLQVLGFLSPPLDNIDVRGRIPLAMDECSVWSRACVQVSRPCCSLKNSISESSGYPSGILSHISSLFLLLWMLVEATPHWRYDSYRLPLSISEALKIVCSSQT